MLLANGNYQNKGTLNFQNPNYYKVKNLFLWIREKWTVANKMRKKIMNNATIPMKMSKKGHNRFSEKSDY